MIRFSNDPKRAEQQMHAILFYLTTFGYIDGDFDDTEKSFVRNYVRKLVEQRVDGAMPNAEAKVRNDLVQKYTTHFHEVFEGIDQTVKELFTEAVSKDEDQDTFVHSKLKLRCFEIFQSFDRDGQEQLMSTIDELIMADGTAHPAELKFRGELSALLESDLSIELVEDDKPAPRVSIDRRAKPEPLQETHPFFDQFEFHYSKDPERMQKQIGADRALLDKTIAVWDGQRAAGAGKLTGKKNIGELAGMGPFLDGHVYAMPTQTGRAYEFTVLGDLHGCYSCLKSALMQSRFFEKVTAFKANPTKVAEPKLVLLGDYIDRGMFSLNGVLRSVQQLAVTAPEHVYVLRGNHEYYVEFKGNIYGGVKPAESINTLKPHLPLDVFQHYMRLFDAMPNMLLAGPVLFVHGGIPRDRLVKERWKDLSTLNDPDIRFQMMWSDPSTADVIPAELQEQSARFAFGKLQAQAFLSRIGAHTIVRGHEKVNEGFRRSYEDGDYQVITLFSAGGKTNDDLPLESSYRSVDPKAMTLEIDTNGQIQISPWEIDYERYNDPERNAFFKAPPEILHRAE